MEQSYSVGDYDLVIEHVLVAHKNQWLHRFYDYRYGRRIYGFVYCRENSAVFDFGKEKIRLEANKKFSELRWRALKMEKGHYRW